MESRSRANWISFAMGLAYIVTYLFLPFCHVAGSACSGIEMFDLSAAAVIPLILAIVITVAACLFPVPISIGAAGALFLNTLLYMIIGSSIFQLNISSGDSVFSLNLFQIGIGSIFCLILVILFIIFELAVNRNARMRRGDDWATFDDTGDSSPFSGGSGINPF